MKLQFYPTTFLIVSAFGRTTYAATSTSSKNLRQLASSQATAAAGPTETNNADKTKTTTPGDQLLQTCKSFYNDIYKTHPDLETAKTNWLSSIEDATAGGVKNNNNNNPLSQWEHCGSIYHDNTTDEPAISCTIPLSHIIELEEQNTTASTYQNSVEHNFVEFHKECVSTAVNGDFQTLPGMEFECTISHLVDIGGNNDNNEITTPLTVQVVSELPTLATCVPKKNVSATTDDDHESAKCDTVLDEYMNEYMNDQMKNFESILVSKLEQQEQKNTGSSSTTVKNIPTPKATCSIRKYVPGDGDHSSGTSFTIFSQSSTLLGTSAMMMVTMYGSLALFL